MQFKLMVIAGPENIGMVYPIEDGEIFLGRSNPPCKIVLNGAKLSKRHCSFQVVNEILKIRDLNSSNGVYVNGQKISERALGNKDRIVVGEYLLEVKVEN